MGISVYSNKITQHFLEFVAVQIKYFIHLFWQKKKKKNFFWRKIYPLSFNPVFHLKH